MCPLTAILHAPVPALVFILTKMSSDPSPRSLRFSFASTPGNVGERRLRVTTCSHRAGLTVPHFSKGLSRQAHELCAPLSPCLPACQQTDPRCGSINARTLFLGSACARNWARASPPGLGTSCASPWRPSALLPHHYPHSSSSYFRAKLRRPPVWDCSLIPSPCPSLCSEADPVETAEILAGRHKQHGKLLQGYMRSQSVDRGREKWLRG